MIEFYANYLDCLPLNRKTSATAVFMKVKKVMKNTHTLRTLYSIDTHFNASTTRSFWKTLFEKKKLLVTSNFFFSHNVFYSIRKI